MVSKLSSGRGGRRLPFKGPWYKDPDIYGWGSILAVIVGTMIWCLLGEGGGE